MYYQEMVGGGVGGVLGDCSPVRCCFEFEEELGIRKTVLHRKATWEEEEV